MAANVYCNMQGNHYTASQPTNANDQQVLSPHPTYVTTLVAAGAVSTTTAVVPLVAKTAMITTKATTKALPATTGWQA